ncbi:hypothetical protein MCAG_00117 [Micromonospora sp. ATCC 39149]|nr:hypothetical protein MCAG_00117 [Micromonospora sp. ATCC 39149]
MRKTPTMPKALPVTHTDDLHQRAGATLGGALERAAAAVAASDFTRAATAAQQLAQYAQHLQTAVVRDALAAGADWWQLGEHLGLHPQAAYEQHRGAAEGLRPPAQQRPQLAVVCTAGLLAEHDQVAEHGVDLDDLGDDHSLTQDPTVARLRAAAELLDEVHGRVMPETRDAVGGAP